ncbi:tetratricopeptide repeat-containing sulfotransferase family protein [Gilvimarinus sp. F26214L]|uniref:tetratricopeptide repeat-containing sulfotransferase family protein n=1 Tax=Gilvimarinus sp. DZF01 TaxID=3461371 RepID=UPI0040466921
MSDANQLYNSALSQLRRKEFLQAAETARRVLGLDPLLIKVWRLLADSVAGLGQLDKAIEYLQQGQRCAEPGSAQWINVSLHLTEVLIRAGRLGEAREALDGLSLSGIEHPEPLAQAAYLYSLCETHSESKSLYERALELAPENVQILFNCAAANRATGDLERAEALYDQVIARRPDDFEAWKNRSDLRRQTDERNHIAELQRACSRPNLPAAGASQLGFALAKEYEDLGDYEKSFAALAEACRLRRSGIRYSLEQDLERLEAIQNVYTGELIGGYEQAQDQNARGEGIIFVLGMPRTGTTLVDRLLCGADSVYSAGEPGTFARELTSAVRELKAPVRKETGTAATIEGPADFVRRSSAIDFAGLGRRYQAELKQRLVADGACVIIDKNPMNFLYVGLIRMALPKARIVHLCRDPMDSCYAILKTQFRNAYPFSYDQSELGQYYLAYRRLMQHWHNVLPGFIYDTPYEKLVENLEEESRRLFDFCGLEWTESVLEFHQQKKQGTATASAAQVRQPVYKSSVGKWKNYRQQLQPLAEVLNAGGLADC